MGLKTRQSRVSNFEVFDRIPDETLFRVIKCGENEGIKSPKSVLITRHPNLLQGSDFLCVLVMNYE